MRGGCSEQPSCPGCRQRDRRIAQLLQRNQSLEQDLQRLRGELQRLQREKKRQAAPFSKGEPKSNPKTPGRKSGKQYGTKGHRLPPSRQEIDETYEVPLPPHCPDCGGAVQQTDVASQYQVEIPRKPIHRDFHIHIGYCQSCGRRVQGRHNLQTSDALGAAAAQVGPDAQAAVVFLNKRLGLSHQKITRCFAELFGITLSPGGSAQIMLRAARRSLPVYNWISQVIARAEQVVPDETGWRICGRKAWVHVLTCSMATLYGVEYTRDATFAQHVLGNDYDEIMVHDGYVVYDQFQEALHQQCLDHAMRRCRALIAAAHGRAICFPRDVLDIFDRALVLRDRFGEGEISRRGLWIMRGRLMNELSYLASAPKRNAEHDRFARHLMRHLCDWFLFLGFPEIDATNYRAEHKLRYIVVNRKVWGGNRTDNGVRAQKVHSSVLITCEQQEKHPIDYISLLLRRIRPPPLFPARLLRGDASSN